MATNTLAEKIPDIYFDWYARLLPGAIAISYYFIDTEAIPDDDVINIVLYVILAYLLGHGIQPVSSFLIRIFQNITFNDNSRYNQAVKDGDQPRLVSLVSKAHAEAVGMLSSCILIILVTCVYSQFDWITIWLIIYFLGASTERVFARKRKITDL